MSATRRRRRASLVLLLSSATSGMLLSMIVSGSPAYLTDYRLNINPDAQHYVILGRNFWSKGVYSRQTEPPYQPDLLRTPVYPVLAGALTGPSGAIWGLYIVQVMLCAGSALFVYGIGRQHFGDDVGFVAGLLFASDVMTAALNWEAMSEPLFVFFTLALLTVWMRMALRPEPPRLRDAVAAGLLAGTAVMTRPAALYLPLILMLIHGVLLMRRRQRRGLLAPLVFVLTASACIGPWIARNNHLYSFPKLTNADTINLLYFAGAGIYQLKYGITRVDAQARIASDYHVPPLYATNNLWMTREPVTEVDARQRAAARQILLAHPRELVISTVQGIAKSFVAHSTGQVAAMSGRTWTPPGLGRLAHGDLRQFLSELAKNSWILTAVFLWQVGFGLSTLVLAGVGLVVAAKRRTWRTAGAVLGAVTLYGVVTIAVVGIDAYARHRAMVVPIFCILSAITIVSASGRRTGAGQESQKERGRSWRHRIVSAWTGL